MNFLEKVAGWIHDKALFAWADLGKCSIDEVYQSAPFRLLRMASRKSSGRPIKRPRKM